MEEAEGINIQQVKNIYSFDQDGEEVNDEENWENCNLCKEFIATKEMKNSVSKCKSVCKK